MVERIVNRGEKYTVLVIDEHYGPGKRSGSTAIEELHDYWTAKGETPPILISCRFAHPEASHWSQPQPQLKPNPNPNRNVADAYLVGRLASSSP